VDAEFPEDVVDALLADLKDEDLARMKEDMSADDIIAALKDAVSAADESEETPKSPPDDDAQDGDVNALAQVFKSMEDNIVKRVTEQLEALEVEVAVPQLQEVMTAVKEMQDNYAAVEATLKEIQTTWDEVLKGDGQRLKEMVENLSPAQRIRLQTTLTSEQAADRIAKFKADQTRDVQGDAPKTDIFHASRSPGAKPIVRDAAGREYEGLGELAAGQPKS
jgi:hypothetical protein